MRGGMTRDTYKKIGLAAVILLAPGGFILGATLAANRLRARRTPPSDPATAPDPAPADPAPADPAPAD